MLDSITFIYILPEIWVVEIKKKPPDNVGALELDQVHWFYSLSYYTTGGVDFVTSSKLIKTMAQTGFHFAKTCMFSLSFADIGMSQAW